MILLISMRDPFLDNDRVMPPLGVMSIKGALDKMGTSCKIENDFKFDGRYTDVTEFWVSCMTPEYGYAVELLRHIQSVYPGKKTVIGGPHTTHYPVTENWDHVFIGDFVTSEILPYREPSFINQYEFRVRGKRATTIMTAKGCPMSCGFCEDAGTHVILHSTDFVSRQIYQCRDAGFDSIMFFDDIFALNYNRVKELTNMISPHNITYRCFGHAKTMTHKMAEMLSKSGCVEIGVGFESGSQSILNTINKRTTIDQYKQFLQLMVSFNIKVKAFFILGLPGETQETIHETEKLLQTLKTINPINDFDMTIYYPYRGTHIRDNIHEYDLQICGAENGVYKGLGGHSDAIVRTSSLSEKQIQSEQQRLLRSYKS